MLLALGALAIVLVLDKDPAPARWTLQGETVEPRAQSFDISIEAWCRADSTDVDRVEVEEDANAVTVTPYVDPAPSGDHLACGSAIPRRVHLEDQLGDRQLLGPDGSPG